MAPIGTTTGLDVSKGFPDLALGPQDPATPQVDRTETDGLDTLAAWLSEHAVRRGGLDASGGYEIAVIDALQARGFAVIRFNAHRIRMFARSNRTAGQERPRRCRGDRAGDRGVAGQATKIAAARARSAG
jgi:transposase